MRLNLAENRRIYSDSGPYKALTESDLALFRDGDTTVSGVAVSSETLAIVCDLGARYLIEELKYYRSPAGSENISLFGKQGPSGDYVWEEIDYTSTSEHVTADLSALSDRYEQIKVIHTVLTGTSTVYELQLWSDDDNILWGEEGQASTFSVDSGTGSLTPERVAFYNPDNISHDFYILIEAEGDNSSGLSLGLTSSGTFYSLYDSGISMPEDIAWSSGQYENTEESDNTVILSPGQDSGFYYSPVIDISSLSGRRLFWKFTTSGTNEIDEQTSLDSLPTVGVRFSNQKPMDPGWVSGQLSNDSLWAVSSGTLTFDTYDNNHILRPEYLDYFQMRLEFFGESTSQTPILEKLGVEQSLSLTILPLQYGEIYVKSSLEDHSPNREASLLVWYFESRNEKQ